ncbi:MAG: protein BatD [Bacteroidetes bacterium]|nr:MAG: protein BatD [Bacteroidota bacterium]
MQKIIITLFLWTLLPLSLWAGEIEFTASAPSEVAAGERFRLTYQVNARPSDFRAPDIRGFRVLSGPSQSSSTSMQMINGRTTVTESFSYTYVLQGAEEGTFTIAPAQITVDGESHRSNSLTVRVRPGTTPPSSPPSQERTEQPSQASDSDLYIRATASTLSPYQGQQVIISYTLYTRVTVNQYSIDRLPSYRGFWTENITAPGQPQTRTEVINGQTYRVAEIYRVAVFPQRSGELRIEPLQTELVVSLPAQRRQSLIDDFFSGSAFGGRQARQTIESNALTLNVKALPTQNRPASFSGMVGTDFEVNASVNQKDLNVNDAVNLSIAISGRGNMRMLEKPSLNFPANLEVFDPNISDNIRNTTSGVSGSRTYDYVMIPRTAGEFVIPESEFVYFDPQAERYVRKPISQFVLQVSGETVLPGTTPGAISQEAIKLLGSDIRYIRTGNIVLTPAGSVFFGSNLFWILIIVPFLLFFFFVIHLRNQIKLQANQELLRNKKAEKLARKRLRKSKTFLDKKQENDFYDEIFKALWGYLSDKLSIPVSILNKENVEGAFRAKKVKQELSDSFMATLNDCEFARFAPGEKEDRMADIYHKALNTIVTIEKDLRNKQT